MYDLSKYKDDIDNDSDEGDDIWELDPAIFHLVLLCTVTVCVVSLVFLVTWIYLKYKTREMNKQQYLYRRAQQTDNQFGVQGTIQDLIEQVFLAITISIHFVLAANGYIKRYIRIKLDLN